MDAFVHLVVSEPQLARLCMVEAAPEPQHRRDGALRALVGALGESAAGQAPRGVEVSPLAAELVVGGLYEIVKARVLARNRAETLLDEQAELTYCLLVPFCGHRKAREVANRAAVGRPPGAAALGSPALA